MLFSGFSFSIPAIKASAAAALSMAAATANEISTSGVVSPNNFSPLGRRGLDSAHAPSFQIAGQNDAPIGPLLLGGLLAVFVLGIVPMVLTDVFGNPANRVPVNVGSDYNHDIAKAKKDAQNQPPPLRSNSAALIFSVSPNFHRHTSSDGSNSSDSSLTISISGDSNNGGDSDSGVNSHRKTD